MFNEWFIYQPDLGWWMQSTFENAEYVLKQMDELPFDWEGWKVAYIPTVVTL